MKRLSVLFLMIVVACNTQKNEPNSADTTQLAPDTTTVTLTSETSTSPDTPSEAATSAPSTIYPDLMDKPLTEDQREAAIVGPLFAMLKQYDADNYLVLTASYSFGYQEEVGPDDTEDVTENQTRTWYFDSLYHLKCYVQQYEFHGTNGGHPPNMKTVYLFSNDSLVAAYVDQVGVYETGKISTRAVAGVSKGGVVLTEKRGQWVDSEDYYELTELEPAALKKLSDTFFLEYRAVLQWLKNSKRPAGDADPYTMTREQGTGDRAFSEEFTLGAELYRKITE